ncbi:MAG: hypothetical protein ACE3L7_19175 [Candidatus Pristimantibacillus sp.]
MFTIQRILGYGLLFFGLLMTLMTGEFSVGPLIIFAGFILVSLSEIIRLMQGTYQITLGLPPTSEQLHFIIQHSPKWLVSSQSLAIYPLNETEYPIIRLHGESYIRARAFLKYMEQKEMEYRFHFPDLAPIVMNCTSFYSPGVDLFEFNDQVFVKLSELPLIQRLEGERYLSIELIAASNE